MRSSCALICSSTCGVPRVTMVMRDRCCSCSVSETVRLSMLYPRPEKRPMTRARTPVRCRPARKACGSPVSLFLGDEIGRAGRLKMAFMNDSSLRKCRQAVGNRTRPVPCPCVDGGGDDLVGSLVRRSISLCALPEGHREAVGKVRDAAVEDHRLADVDHLWMASSRSRASRSGCRGRHRPRRVDEVGHRLRVGMRQPVAVQQLLPWRTIPMYWLFRMKILIGARTGPPRSSPGSSSARTVARRCR